ncbi:putative acyltransferase [Luminiphilus syltensis NOR5-1B]|uniref:Putative acyltransferase n=1 Tax=Luminiphilus syltensis NOR5-1B TaxID=565045 RepID=B8KS91_9GAMM|nr:1-acyl-sn-glycerol-3-phosphate acyltransferase [Luminiphilus syltensis]EED34142.1 putative acyltransferase [Luminiphilus syltensis NOR5-1B]
MADATSADNEIDIERHIEQVLAVHRPVGPALSAAAAFMKRWFKPTFTGLERLPSGPALFVGNHALLAIDGAIFANLMNYDYGRFLRGIGDRTLFANERYAKFAIAQGAAVGQRPVVEALMAAGQDLLIFPGGAHEAVKRPEQRYDLLWRERFGFVRIAAFMGFTIMPFAAVGPDEYFEHHIEGDELLDLQLVRWLMSAGVVPDDFRRDLLPPIPSGVFGSPMPKPKTTFFGFGRPIDLSAFAGKELTDRQQHRIRDRVAGEIEEQVFAMLKLREQRRHHDGLLRRILSL